MRPRSTITRHEGSTSPSSEGARPLRVLMIAPTSFFADYGCHVRILEEARVLQKLGHAVTICTYHNGRDLPDVTIRRTPSIPWRRDYEVGSSWHKVGFDLLLSLRSFTAMLQVRPDVIHAHLHEGALIGLVLSRLLRVPLVFDFQGSLTGEMVDHHFLSANGRFFGPLLRLEKWIDRACQRIITSSSHAAELLTREFSCSPQRVTWVPDCVNTDHFHPLVEADERARLRHAYGIPAGHSVIVYLGLLAEYQGTGHLLHAMRSLCDRRDDVHCVIAGYPHVETYRHLAAELGILDHVSFPGRVPYEQAPRILALGDIAVSPKLSKTEGAGKLLNYMAMGLPTVAFDTDVSHEYLGECGVYATRGDSEDLARCLETLVDDPAQRAQLGDAARQRARGIYSWDTAGQLIVDAYESLRRPARRGPFRPLPKPPLG
ncbi:MAG: glycosyltransferase family 4 protein [Anaerolineae bacterium]